MLLSPLAKWALNLKGATHRKQCFWEVCLRYTLLTEVIILLLLFKGMRSQKGSEREREIKGTPGISMKLDLISRYRKNFKVIWQFGFMATHCSLAVVLVVCVRNPLYPSHQNLGAKCFFAACLQWRMHTRLSSFCIHYTTVLSRMIAPALPRAHNQIHV